MKTILDVKRRLAAARCPYPVSLMDDLEEAFAEIERLKAEKVELWDCPGCGFTYDACHEDIDHATGEGNGNHTCPVCENADLERENERLCKELKGALKVIRWYSDESNYVKTKLWPGDPACPAESEISEDGGERARSFLVAQEEEVSVPLIKEGK
ncbi:hypothetical protein [Paenibacillus sp. FSL R7-0026]|uniref:hypothetical protein n=1 Tax=Paenibacillus sp. FSL R7-0026 TaxID=2921668 RepID=UPI0030F8681C